MKIPVVRRAVRIRVGESDALKLGLSRYNWRDPYYVVLTLRWPAFFGGVLGFYGFANFLFAILYWLDPTSVAGAKPHGRFLSDFFFSVETLATVGYGAMFPGDLYGHALSSLEIVFGLILAAIITGLVFARFSRPKARLLFSEVAVIAPYEGKTALMARVVSERNQAIADATARMMVLRESRTPGHVMRRFTDLTLVRSYSPIVALSWTLIHIIDEASPLWGKSLEELDADDVSIFVSIGGYDEGISARIVDRKTYPTNQIRYGHAFEDIMSDLPDGTIILDLTRFHRTRPMSEAVTADGL